MKLSDEFPGKYLREPNLKGKPFKTRILSVFIGRYANGEKSLELTLAGTEQVFGLNAGMRNQCLAAFGDDTDNWIGETIILYPTTIEYQNNPEYPVVRMKIPPKPAPTPIASPDLPKYDEVAEMNTIDDVFCPGDDEPPI